MSTKYVINPMVASEPSIATVALEECDVAGVDYQHMKKHGFIWDTRDQAELALKHMLTFGRRIRAVHEGASEEEACQLT